MKEIKELTEFTGLPCVVDDGKPAEGLGESYFVIAKNGFYKVVDNDEIRAAVCMGKMPGSLPEAGEELRWKGPRVPLDDFRFLTATMMRFWRKSRAEIDFHIHYSKSTGFWYRVPRQEVSGVRTDWDIDGGSVWLKDGRVVDAPPADDTDLHRIGNMHSHHSMPPVWSDTDNKSMHDVEYGIQMVIGWFLCGFGVQCRIAFNGRYTDVPLAAVVDMGETPAAELPDWLFEPQQPAAPGTENKSGKRGKNKTGERPEWMRKIFKGEE